MSSGILVAIRIKAAPDRVFEAFTRDIALWWRPNGLFEFTPNSKGTIAFEPGQGGRLIETQPDGSTFEVGTITAWEPPARLAFTWRQASFTEGQITSVEVRFDAVADGTRVTVEHRGWDTVPAPHQARHGFPDGVFLTRHGEYWRALLEALRSLVAG